MKKIYFLLFALVLGANVNAQVDLRTDLINYTTLQATSDDPLPMDFYVINDGTTISTGDTLFLALLITDLGTNTNNYFPNDPVGSGAGSVGQYVLPADFNNGDTLGFATAALDMQWMYGESPGGNSLNFYVCATAFWGQTAFVTGGQAGVGMEANAINNNDCVDYTVTWVTGIDEADLGDITVYPNPANDQLNIYLGNNEVEYVQIMDISGRIIDNIQVTGNTETLDVSGYQDGVYFYSIIQDGEITMTDKFVVSK